MSYIRPARRSGELLSWPTLATRGWVTADRMPPIVQGAIQWITISLGGAYLPIVGSSLLYATNVVITHIFLSIEGPYSQTGVVNIQAPGFLAPGFRPTAVTNRSLTLPNGQTMAIQFNPPGDAIFYRPTGSSAVMLFGHGFFQWPVT